MSSLPRPSAATAASTVVMTTLAMLAFAGNSLLCRAALDRTATDPLSFTLLRLAAGAAVLSGWLAVRGGSTRPAGSWPSAFALFGYAIGFSLAYTALPAGTGALLLFGAVQATMLAGGLLGGARWSPLQCVGLVLAMIGLVLLLLPGLQAPAPWPAISMLLAGIAWGVYSLRGRRQLDATAATAGNFLRALPMAALAGALALPWLRMDAAGAALAVVSGAITSGLGYAVWYVALRNLSAPVAGSSQLAVPVITAVAGAWLLQEAIGLRLVVASIAVLGGIALTLPWQLRR